MLSRLRAKIALESGEFDLASQLFLEAYAHAPGLDQAKQNRVLALSLAKDSQTAYAIAKQYVAEGLTSPVMVLRLVDNIASPEQLQEHGALIDSLTDTDADINTSLSHKYLAFGDYDRAAQAADRALKIQPDSPHAHLAAAFCAHRAAVYGDPQHRQERLRAALEHYNSAEGPAREQRFINLLPEILVNRAAAKMLTSDTSGAAADYRAAISAAPTKSTVYVERAIAFFLQTLDFASAWELLDSLDRTSLEAQYLALVTEYQDSTREEKRAYVDDMLALADQDWDRAVECRFQCVQWAIELGEHALAESCVPPSFQDKHPFQAHVMLAWSRMTTNRQSAKEEADKALNESIRSAHPQELRLLGHILVKLQDDANALGLLEQVTTPGHLNDDMKALISCAQRLSRHDVLLRICAELRAAGTFDEQLLKLEVQLLSHYAPKVALSLAEELIAKSAKPAFFVAAKNMMAVRVNELDKLTLDPSSLPLPADLLPGETDMVCLPYVTMGLYDDALRFLYAQRRLYFEDEDAHGRYIYFFLTYEQKTTLHTAPTAATSDSAVLLESDRGEQRWVIIEDEQPVASRGEFSSSSDLAHSILERSVDDKVTLPGNPVQPQTATIRQIQTKYLRAFQDSIHNFVKRFPGTSVLQQVNVGDDENFDPSAIIASLQSRREHVEKCITLYRDNPCSLYLFAERVGLTEMEAIKALSQHPDGLIKCCQATADEFERAAKAGMPAQAVVLSISAIITLSLIDGWKYLHSGRTYFISQLTSEVIDGWIHAASDTGAKEGGVVSLDDNGQLIYRETTAAERTTRLEELRAIKDATEAHCTRESSVAVANLTPEKRDLYQQVMGLHNVEAISLANDHKAAIWSDDLVVGFVANTDFAVPHVWTQLALCFDVESGVLRPEEFSLVTAKLASWHYISIVWNPSTIIAAGAEADWDPQRWPFSQCIGLIKNTELPVPAKARIVLEFLQRLRRSNCIDLKQSAVIQAALNALSDARAARWLLSRIDLAFGVDVPSALFVRLEIEYWLKTQ